MSSTFQTVVRGPSLCAFGNFPALTPAHQLEREMGYYREDLPKPDKAGFGKSVISILRHRASFVVLGRPRLKRNRRGPNN